MKDKLVTKGNLERTVGWIDTALQAVQEAIPEPLPALTGNGGKVLAVNSGEDGLEWVDNSIPNYDVTPSGVITTSPNDSITFERPYGNTLTVAPFNFESGESVSNTKWYLDGVLDASYTDSTRAHTITGLTAGAHTLMCSIITNKSREFNSSPVLILCQATDTGDFVLSPPGVISVTEGGSVTVTRPTGPTLRSSGIITAEQKVEATKWYYDKILLSSSNTTSVTINDITAGTHEIYCTIEDNGHTYIKKSYKVIVEAKTPSGIEYSNIGNKTGSASITFSAGSRKYYELSTSGNITLNVNASDRNENYVLVNNTGTSSITVSIGTVNSLSAGSIKKPDEDMEIPAGGSVEISFLVFSSKAIIACSNTLV